MEIKTQLGRHKAVREESRVSAAGYGVHRGAEGGETDRSPLGP